MTAARNQALATQARRVYLEALVRGMTPLVAAIGQGATQLLSQGAPHSVMLARRDAVQAWQKIGPNWQMAVVGALRHAALHGVADTGRDLDSTATAASQKMTLVDDSTIEREITSSRLALVMMDRATWEFTDLRTRMQALEAHDDLEPLDLLRAHVVARIALDAWTRVGLGAEVWQLLHHELHEEFAQLISEAYHETNRWLIAQKVLPEVDLRPFIRRTAQAAREATAAVSVPVAAPTPVSPASSTVASGVAPLTQPSGSGELPRSRASSQADEVMAQLQRVLARHVPGFPVSKSQSPARPGSGRPSLAALGGLGGTGGTGGVAGNALAGAGGELSGPSVGARPALADAPPAMPASPRLMGAIKHAQESFQRRPGAAPASSGGGLADLGGQSAPRQLEEIGARNQAFKQVLKQAASTPAERATIEIVAMLFQSILTEERIPATVRVWFARLQMPVLRVAVSEPDFFAAADHPARRLIDRMGACVMGFNTAQNTGPGSSDALEREIKRVVQVVEAYPDTGRRVFATVLTEFEKFLDHYFENENQASKRGVSLAQQVEQRETLAIQYTIELRKMLSEVPVQDGVRDFLFHVWADVLAVTAVRSGAQAEVTKAMKRAAADLIWSASAKSSREDRAEVIRRLPPLLKTLRDGMSHAGLAVEKQDEHVRQLNNALAAAFTAKTAAIPRERLDELMDQLETLEAMLPEELEGEGSVDEMLVRDLSGHESDGMEVVAEGGSAPTPAMVAWARELQVGGWFMLDYRGRNEQVQLAWRGLRKQLALFVTPKGRGVLFSLNRMAAFLQAGLLLPAQDEALTVRATRKALAKLDADPSQLLK
ncbi:DUF1631 family protein [Roseateles cellulosilyticus]|uniref:DUF1631 domain-containing protein n=1 Tax=Pelomonas cellulosilytica TaxID=2906762 RepID=A0ABS8XT43_9BURK|nr:DUF1631 family protein [Pelomonas sp. P8]MCE4554067.1 DUF1631 domain-containing protein [Pelomonas sp. P8]